MTGTVTLDGQPLAEAVVLFRPTEGRPGYARVKDGAIVDAYTFGDNDGIVVGDHRLAVHISKKDTPLTALSPEDGLGRGGYMGAPKSRGKSQPVIPRKFQNPSSSGLTFTVEEGTNELNLSLSSD